ncbi:MAG: glutamine synthetase family protein [Gaiellales bacterium]
MADTAALTTLRDSLAAQGVTRVRVIHADPHGRPRSKDYPLSSLTDLASGIGYCEASLVEGLDGEPLMDPPHPGGIGLPDTHAVPDATTARQVPWDPQTAWILADVVDPGHAPSGLCVRSLLKAELARLQALGYRAVSASEPEFYLLEPGAGATVGRYSPGVGLAYTSGWAADPDGVLRAMQDACVAMGLGVTAAHREVSPGQFEMNLNHGEALDATDRVFLFEEVVRETAGRHGLRANFMGKPFADAEGSSHHIHLSLWRGDANAFARPEGGLSEIGRAFAAGLIAHAPALTALGCPTINSFKRLANANIGLAPLQADMGGDDRTAYLRVPPQNGAATRVELRIGDASANPYLLLTAALAAGRDGIERGLAIGDPVALPQDLGAALAALEADTIVAGALGERMVRTVVDVKRRELHRFARVVTEWEWTEYADHV